MQVVLFQLVLSVLTTTLASLEGLSGYQREVVVPLNVCFLRGFGVGCVMGAMCSLHSHRSEDFSFREEVKDTEGVKTQPDMALSNLL